MEMVEGAETPMSRSKAMHWTLWVIQGLLAAMFLMAGFMKLSMPIDQLAQKLPWVTDISAALVRFIGLAELTGAIGLILPSATRVRPILTVFAAIGLALVMALALGFHVSRGETSVIGMNLLLGGLAAFVAWGRLRKAPISPRS